MCLREQANERRQVFLFGKFCFEIDGKATYKIEPRKAEELLGFLLLNRDQPHSRERLADLLWGKLPKTRQITTCERLYGSFNLHWITLD